MKCSVEGCEREAHRKGWCDLHYLRQWKTGDLGEVSPKSLHPDFSQKIRRRLISMYQRGWSCPRLAKRFGYTKNKMITLMRYEGIIRNAPGRVEENMVLDYLRKQGRKVMQKRGDWYYDALVDGRKIDVKSARISTSFHDGHTYPRYYFEVKHRESVRSNQTLIDYYYLLFKESMLLCALPANQVHVQKTVSFPEDPFKSTKYFLQFIGYLPIFREEK